MKETKKNKEKKKDYKEFNKHYANFKKALEGIEKCSKKENIPADTMIHVIHFKGESESENTKLIGSACSVANLNVPGMAKALGQITRLRSEFIQKITEAAKKEILKNNPEFSKVIEELEKVITKQKEKNL